MKKSSQIPEARSQTTASLPRQLPSSIVAADVRRLMKKSSQIPEARSQTCLVTSSATLPDRSSRRQEAVIGLPKPKD